MLIKITNDTLSNHNKDNGLTSLIKPEYQPWKWIEGEWIKQIIETSNNEVSND